MAQYTITYFPVRARSEFIRLLLADQGCEWNEEEVPIKEWYDGKDERKKNAVFGQIPRLTEGDFSLYQSNAILRYLGRQHDLYGRNNKEASLIDMVNDGVEDFRQKYFQFFFKEWETGQEKYLEQLPNMLMPFERILSQNRSGFLVGNKVSFADYSLLDMLQNHLVFTPDCLDPFPHLTAFKEKMEARPKLKAYLESEARMKRLFDPRKNM